MALGVALKALVIWLGILALAIGNGAVREALLVPRLGRAPGLILSGLLLAGVILAVAFWCLPWLGPLPAAGYAGVGLGWLCLAVAFEFGFGRLVRHEPWSALIEAYTFKGGNIWPLVLAVTAAAPYLAAWLRGWA